MKSTLLRRYNDDGYRYLHNIQKMNLERVYGVLAKINVVESDSHIFKQTYRRNNLHLIIRLSLLLLLLSSSADKHMPVTAIGKPACVRRLSLAIQQQNT